MALQWTDRIKWWLAVAAVLLAVIAAAGCNGTSGVVKDSRTINLTKDAEAIQTAAENVRKSAATIDTHAEAIDVAAPGLAEPALIRAETTHLRATADTLDDAGDSVADTQPKVEALETALARANSKAAQRERWVWVMFSIGGALALIASIGVFKFVGPGMGGTVAAMGGLSLLAGIIIPRVLTVADSLVTYLVWGLGIIAAVFVGVIVYQMIRRKDTLVRDLVGTVERVKEAAPEAWQSIETHVATMQSPLTKREVARVRGKP